MYRDTDVRMLLVKRLFTSYSLAIITWDTHNWDKEKLGPAPHTGAMDKPASSTPAQSKFPLLLKLRPPAPRQTKTIIVRADALCFFASLWSCLSYLITKLYIDSFIRTLIQSSFPILCCATSFYMYAFFSVLCTQCMGEARFSLHANWKIFNVTELYHSP